MNSTIDVETALRAKEILKNNLINPIKLKNKSYQVKNLKVSQSILNQIKIVDLKNKKGFYFLNIKYFHKRYLLNIFSNLLKVNKNLLLKLNKSNYQNNKISKFTLKPINRIVFLQKRLTKNIIKCFIQLNYKNRFEKSKNFIKSNTNQIEKLNLIINYEKTFLTNFNKFFKTFKNKNLKNLLNKDLNLGLVEILKKFTKLSHIIRYYLNSADLESIKKSLTAIVKRAFLVISIYFLPFIFLATQGLIIGNEDYEYLLVNPICSQIFTKIPFLLEGIKFFYPLYPKHLFLFVLGYYLIFPHGYKSLKIPYEVAYNGTIASVFLVLNYSTIILQQSLIKFLFESMRIIKDVFFTSFLFRYISKNKYLNLEDAVQMFSTCLYDKPYMTKIAKTNLVDRHNLKLMKNYYQFLVFINHRIFSLLALISLTALLYNCIYYTIHNKHPKILFVTKSALALIRNPQQEN